ncbi:MULTISPECIES: SigB/SigF/SigG family RNA polymerase sigma factor [unclassified Fusibacter]|uniref:SigB/SigF/SigG family RNA polymerase sigma factor n=1 Tax=unclassified Fusibacter TaxID=2624464 RepID=UPI001013B7A5|nr:MULTISPECIES: SigB/SigF/SigG family RNA polymerase sigma factor [unclassified Fusibacter]MCK8060839.1 SigB/SigF/SigG family RNA polymerase sigma factor [Fusibacter sp. A2]NPE23135.1 SigB/SigF/SigG family RNA polymerase sigma factor [Fusibacter sp. A1]RXV59493.1 SigB/SigF/SigG family RNA polymerase sigma factor [Fusibacter sp. A1]
MAKRGSIHERTIYSDYETKALFRLYSDDKNLVLRNELVNRHLYISEILAKKYINKGIDYEDIFQVAALGLIYAIERFDVERGFEFSSFATPTIIGEIKKYFRDKGWSVRVPRRIQELSKKINVAKVKLQQDLQRVPKIEDIADYLSCTQEQVIEAMEASQVYTPKSLDITYDSSGDDKDIQLMDIVGEDDKYFDIIENKDFIEKCMEKLNPVEIKIIKDRFFQNKTQINVADELGVSQMTVSRMEKKIIKKFQKEYRKLTEI